MNRFPHHSHSLLRRITGIPARLALRSLEPLRDAQGEAFTAGHFQHLRPIALRLTPISVDEHHQRPLGQQRVRDIKIMIADLAFVFQAVFDRAGNRILQFYDED